MERPSTEILTDGDHKVILRDYITGAEHREIRAIYMRALRQPEKEQDASQMTFTADNKAIELAVVSVDGIASDVVTLVLALPLPDFNQVIAAVTEIVEGKKKSEISSQAI
jgi:hypothetical protein